MYPTEKFGIESIISICPVNRLNILITDWMAGEDDLAAFRDLGIEVVLVEQPGGEGVLAE